MCTGFCSHCSVLKVRGSPVEHQPLRGQHEGPPVTSRRALTLPVAFGRLRQVSLLACSVVRELDPIGTLSPRNHPGPTHHGRPTPVSRQPDGAGCGTCHRAFLPGVHALSLMNRRRPTWRTLPTSCSTGISATGSLRGD